MKNYIIEISKKKTVVVCADSKESAMEHMRLDMERQLSYEKANAILLETKEGDVGSADLIISEQAPLPPTEQSLIMMIVNNLPSSAAEFKDVNGFGEEQHWVNLPNGYHLEILHQPDYAGGYIYSYNLYGEDVDTDLNPIDSRTSESFDKDTVCARITWAIYKALELG